MAVHKDDVWILGEGEYDSLVADSGFLQNLRDAGVDNWDGYHYGYGLEEADPEDR